MQIKLIQLQFRTNATNTAKYKGFLAVSIQKLNGLRIDFYLELLNLVCVLSQV